MGEFTSYNKLKQKSNRYSAFNWDPVYGAHHNKNIMDDFMVAPIGKRYFTHTLTTQDNHVADQPANWMNSVELLAGTMRRRSVILPSNNAGATGTVGSVCMNSLVPGEEWTNRLPVNVPETIQFMRTHYALYRVTSCRLTFTCDVQTESITSGNSLTWGLGVVYSPTPKMGDTYNEEDIRFLIDGGRISVKPIYHATSYAAGKSVVDTGWVNIMGQFQPEVSTFGPPEVAAFMGELGADNTDITRPDTLIYAHPFLFFWDTDASAGDTMSFELACKVEQKVFFYQPNAYTVEDLATIREPALLEEGVAAPVAAEPFDHTEEAESAFDQPVTAFNLGKRKRTQMKIVENDTNIPEDKVQKIVELPIDIEPDVQILSPLK